MNSWASSRDSVRSLQTLDVDGAIHRNFQIHGMPKKLDTVDLDVLERLGRAREFIDHCYDHPLSLEQMSEKACFSRYHFLRLFRQAYEKTPHQYLIERRIEKAKELLIADGLRVTDVCFEVGFQSLGSFSSLFQKRVGHAPITFREKARQREEAKRQVPGCFLVMYKLESAL